MAFNYRDLYIDSVVRNPNEINKLCMRGVISMNVKHSMALVAILALVLVGITGSEALAGYISSVEIHVDGFICATCVDNIKRTLEQEDGVAEVSGDWADGIVGVTPAQDIGWVNLFDFAQRINSTRNYSVLKMEVSAVGSVVKFPVEYYTGGLYAYSGDRYKLQIGDTRRRHFILARNEKLDELVKSENKAVRVFGTVTAFSESVPILAITEFENLGDEEATRIIEDYDASVEKTPDNISSVELHIDGYICAVCTRILESNLATEEGVAKVDADPEKRIVTVIPTKKGEQVDPFYLKRRVNSLRDYSVSRIDVEVVGTVTNFPVRYFQAREYTHHHDRYKLQIRDKYFVLAENDKLQELIDSKLKRARIKGTVIATSEGKSILAIGDFQSLDGKSTLGDYEDPLDLLAASLVGERKIPEEVGHAHIDSVRVYVDGFICATCEKPLLDSLLEEKGVKIGSTDAELGLIEIIPEKGQPFDLHDIKQSINAMREYQVLKVEVVASGKIDEIEMGFGEDTLYPEKNTRYVLSAGKLTGFLISENDKLAEILKSDGKAFTVIGTVGAFRGKTPILYISDFKKLDSYPEWLKTES